MKGGEATIALRTARDAVRADRILSDNNIATAVVPVPRELSAECGMALRVAQSDLATACELLKSNGIYVTTI